MLDIVIILLPILNQRYTAATHEVKRAHFVRSGMIDGDAGQLRYGGIEGSFLSSQAYSSFWGSYRLLFNSARVYSSNNSNTDRYRAFSLRCLSTVLDR